MHHGDNLDEIRSRSVHHSVGEVCYSALAYFALHLAVGVGVALYAVQCVFEVVEEALREAGLFSL